MSAVVFNAVIVDAMVTRWEEDDEGEGEGEEEEEDGVE